MYAKSSVLLACLVVGCASAPPKAPEKPHYSLIGTWAFEKAPADIESGIEFKNDKTWHNWYRSKGQSAEQSGRYSLDGNDLTMTRTFAKQSNRISSKEETNKTVLHWDTQNRVSMIGKDGTPMYLNRK